MSGLLGFILFFTEDEENNGGQDDKSSDKADYGKADYMVLKT